MDFFCTTKKESMKTGIFISEQELAIVKTAIATSGMWLPGGQPMGNPQHEVLKLSEKYKAPKGAGLNPKTGE